MKYLILFFFFILIGCSTKTYVNKSGSCKLKLHKDSTYDYKYPTFLRAMRDKGTYKIKQDSILLSSTIHMKHRSFYFHNDTIVVSGVDPKAIGRDRKLVRKH